MDKIELTMPTKLQISTFVKHSGEVYVPFPLQAPESALAMIAIGNVVDIPQISVQTMVQVKPIRMVGFLPNLSDALPQSTAVKHCDREKTADVRPAHFGTFFLSMPKLSIISG